MSMLRSAVTWVLPPLLLLVPLCLAEFSQEPEAEVAGSLRSRRRAPLGFSAMRGKRLRQSSFYAMRGRRADLDSDTDQDYMDQDLDLDQSQMDYQPELVNYLAQQALRTKKLAPRGFSAMRGKRPDTPQRRTPLGFSAMRGKRDVITSQLTREVIGPAAPKALLSPSTDAERPSHSAHE